MKQNMKLSELLNKKKGNQPLSVGQRALLASSGVPKDIRDSWDYQTMKKHEENFKSKNFESTNWQIQYITNIMGVEIDTDPSYVESQAIIIDHIFENEPDEEIEKYIRNQIQEREERAKQRYSETKKTKLDIPLQQKEPHNDFYSQFRNKINITQHDGENDF